MRGGHLWLRIDTPASAHPDKATNAILLNKGAALRAISYRPRAQVQRQHTVEQANSRPSVALRMLKFSHLSLSTNFTQQTTMFPVAYAVLRHFQRSKGKALMCGACNVIVKRIIFV